MGCANFDVTFGSIICSPTDTIVLRCVRRVSKTTPLVGLKIFGTSASAVPYKMKFNLFGKFGFVDVFSILKQVKDKQPSLKGKVPDRADGWSVSDQKSL